MNPIECKSSFIYNVVEWETNPQHCRKDPPQSHSVPAMMEEAEKGRSHPLCAHNLGCHAGCFQTWCMRFCTDSNTDQMLRSVCHRLVLFTPVLYTKLSNYIQSHRKN